jgi:transcriptional regulator with XRE-family HTH domain
MGNDLDRLREALRALVEGSGRSIRDLEREIGLGHGTIGNMLHGRTELRLRHLDRLSRALGIPLQELLAQAFAVLPQPPARPRQARLRSLVAEVVREELEDFWERHAMRCKGAELVAEGEDAEPL